MEREEELNQNDGEEEKKKNFINRNNNKCLKETENVKKEK